MNACINVRNVFANVVNLRKPSRHCTKNGLNITKCRKSQHHLNFSISMVKGKQIMKTQETVPKLSKDFYVLTFTLCKFISFDRSEGIIDFSSSKSNMVNDPP